MTIGEANKYWEKKDEELRKQGINPRPINPKSIAIWQNKGEYLVSYYDSTANHQKLMTTGKFWSEALDKEIKNYNPNSSLEAHAYHSIVNMLNAYCKDITPKKKTPKQEPEHEPQLCARLKPVSEEDWIIRYEPITTTTKSVSIQPKGYSEPITFVVYDTTPSGPIYKKRSKPVSNEDWVVEEFVVNADGTETIRRHYTIEDKYLKDWKQGFMRRRNKVRNRKKRSKSKDNHHLDWAERIANAPPAKVVSNEGPFMGTKLVSKKEETVIEPGYGTPMTKTTYEYERYIKFNTEESLNEFVADHNIILGEPQLGKYISRVVLSRDVYGQDNKRYQHLMVPVRKCDIAPRVWRKTENNTLVYEHSVEISYQNEYWSTTLSNRQHVIELPPLDCMAVDISEEEEEYEYDE